MTIARGSFDFAQVFERSPNPYMLVDRDLRYVAANAAYLRVTSSRLEDLLGRNVFDVFPDDDPSGRPSGNALALRASFARVLATRETDTLAFIPYRVPCQLSDGSIADEERFWSATHTPVLDESGEVALILQHTVDVTELHRLQEATSAAVPLPQLEQGVLGRARAVQETNDLLARERGMLRQLFDQAPGFIAFLRGPSHVFELVNAAYRRLVGFRALAGKTVAEALPEVSAQGFLTLLDRVYQTGEPFVGRAVKVLLAHARSGSLEERYLDFVYQPILDEQGRVFGIFVQGSDITEQKRAEAERERLAAVERAARARAESAEREWRFLAEAIPQHVWTRRPDGTIDFISARALEYFGMGADPFATRWEDVVHPDDLPLVRELWQKSMRTGDEYEVQYRLRRRDGAFIWHLSRAVPMRDERGGIVRWYGTSTDIDEAKRARDELGERVRFEQQLIGIVSHDLRSPLSAIALAASFLLKRGNLDDQQGKTVGRMVSQVERAMRLIRDFLDFTQARSAGEIPIEPAAANLQRIARDAVDEVHVSHADRTVHVAHHGDPFGRWDPDRLAQVVGNLVGNAFQHSDPPAAVRVTTSVDADTATIEVQNDGPPIAPADLKRLFAPFQRGNGARPGSGRSVGLGLYITQAIVAAHGGRIEVHSTAEAGTRFVVRLPRETSR